jgi:arylsulfatase A-like enzyme
MNTSGLLVLALGVALAMPVPLSSTPQSTAPRRPNILFILADDFGSEAADLYPELYDTGAASGRGQVPIPTLTALASRGLVFDHAWATPLCSPTRAALLTGLYGHNTGVTLVNHTLPESTTSIFELLAASTSSPRYRMGVFGKWHLNGARGEVAHVVNGTGVPLFKGFLGGFVPDNYNWTVDSSTGPSTTSTVYTTTALTDFAIDFIRATNSEPWFAYLPYGAPHGTAPNNGFQVPPEHLFTVDVGGRKAGDHTIYNGAIPVYQATIQALDTEIGRLFRAMNEAGQLDNTLIIFMGDNGTPASVKDPAARIRGSKRSVYEGGVRVPLVVAGPGVTRRGREAHLVAAEDIFATIADLAGVPLVNNAINDGYSLVPLFGSGQVGTGRRYAFTELCGSTGAGDKHFAIRGPQYKLVYSDEEWGLFDLQRDPWETTNLYDSAPHAGARAELLAELRALRAKAATNGCFVDPPQ